MPLSIFQQNLNLSVPDLLSSLKTNGLDQVVAEKRIPELSVISDTDNYLWFFALPMGLQC